MTEASRQLAWTISSLDHQLDAVADGRDARPKRPDPSTRALLHARHVIDARQRKRSLSCQAFSEVARKGEHTVLRSTCHLNLLEPGTIAMSTDRGNASERPRVVAEARRWIGTPYHPCADVLGAGVDCGMLIVRVFVDTGLVPPFDPRPYPPDWHLHRSEERYLGFVFDRCREVAEPEPGDVVVFRYGRCFAHGGILTRAEPPTLVHAFSPAGAVIEEALGRNAALAGRPRRAFSLWPGRTHQRSAA